MEKLELTPLNVADMENHESDLFNFLKGTNHTLKGDIIFMKM